MELQNNLAEVSFNFVSDIFGDDDKSVEGFEKEVVENELDKLEVNQDNLILTDDQKRALDLMQKGENIFLTGAAGTGKSYVLRKFISMKGDKVMVTAPTGIGAVNINGATLHRAFNLPIGVLSREILLEQNRQTTLFVGAAKLLHVDTLIIDEVSMCREDVFNIICAMIKFNKVKHNHNVQLIVCGDFYQLPPVIAGKDGEIFKKIYSHNKKGWAFNSRLWDELNIRTVELKEVVRQKDKAFSISLSMIRQGDTAGLDLINLKRNTVLDDEAVTICGKNATADLTNQYKLNQLNGSSIVYKMSTKGDVDKGSNLSCEEKLVLKTGARVIVIANDHERAYINGDTGTVQTISNDCVRVLIDRTQKSVIIKAYTWNVYNYREVADEDDEEETSEEISYLFDELEKAKPKKKSRKTHLKKIAVGSYTQIPLRLGWAITVHKSQGQTFDAVNLKHSEYWMDGQLYVALSRCRKIENLSFEECIHPSAVMCSKDAEEFYLTRGENCENYEDVDLSVLLPF